MSIKRIALLAIMIILLPVFALAHEGGVSTSAAVAHYAAMAKTLSEDSTEGIQEHATEMLEFMDQHADMMKMMDDGSMKSMQGKMMGHEGAEEAHGKMMDAHHEAEGKTAKESASMMMRKALETLSSKDLDLKQARSAFNGLSAEFVPLAQMNYENSPTAPTWVVMNCPMAKADWIQKKGDTKNPYLGTKMLSCGKQVCVLGSKDKGSM